MRLMKLPFFVAALCIGLALVFGSAAPALAQTATNGFAQTVLDLFHDQIVQIAVTGLTALLGWLALTLRSKAHIETRQILIDILHGAALTGAQVAVGAGASAVTTSTVQSVIDHMATSIPETLQKIGITNPSTNAALVNIAKVKLQQALDWAHAPRPATTEDAK